MDRQYPRGDTSRLRGHRARATSGRRRRALPGIALGLALVAGGVGCGADQAEPSSGRTGSSGTPTPTPKPPPTPISSGLGAPSEVTEERQPADCRLPDLASGDPVQVALVFGKPAATPRPGLSLRLQTRDPNATEATVQVVRTAADCRGTAVVVFRGPDAVKTLGLELTASAPYPDYDDSAVARVDVTVGAAA